MSEPLRWGILGATSRIARNAVVPALVASPLHEVVAQASRGADGSFAPYRDLLARDDLDIVYNPLPNGLHREWVEAAAATGVASLCEKPLGVDAAEVRSMVASCRTAGVPLIEAYMTPYHPRTRRLLELVASGRLGELRSMRTEFTFPLDDRSDHRLHPVLGGRGGPLLDVGIYCLAPMLAITGCEPRSVASWRADTADGVASTFSGWLDFGVVEGSFMTSFDAPERQHLEVVGTEGRIVLTRAFTPGPADTAITITSRDGSSEVVSVDSGTCYREMVDAVHAHLRDGTPLLHTLDDTLAVARTIDRLQAAA